MNTIESTNPPADVTSPIPRWLHVIALGPIAVLLGLAALLVVGFITAGPEENLAGVLLIFAAILIAVAAIAGALWGVGFALRRRAPTAARVLIATSSAVGGLALLSQASLWLSGV